MDGRSLTTRTSSPSESVEGSSILRLSGRWPRSALSTVFAIEVKSFIGPSPMSDLGEAVGQYLLYKSWLARTDLERTLYLATDTVVAVDVFGDPSAQVLVEDYRIRLLVVDVQQQRISAWRD